MLKLEHDIQIKSIRDDSSGTVYTPSRSKYSSLLQQLSNSVNRYASQLINSKNTSYKDVD